LCAQVLALRHILKKIVKSCILILSSVYLGQISVPGTAFPCTVLEQDLVPTDAAVTGPLPQAVGDLVTCLLRQISVYCRLPVCLVPFRWSQGFSADQSPACESVPVTAPDVNAAESRYNTMFSCSTRSRLRTRWTRVVSLTFRPGSKSVRMKWWNQTPGHPCRGQAL
jgi:hypothetical protein